MYGSTPPPPGFHCFIVSSTLLAESLRFFLDESTYLGRSKETLFAGYVSSVHKLKMITHNKRIKHPCAACIGVICDVELSF